MSFLTELKFHIEHDNHVFSDDFHQTVEKKIIKLFAAICHAEIGICIQDNITDFVMFCNRPRNVLEYHFKFNGILIKTTLAYSEYKFSFGIMFPVNKKNTLSLMGSNLVMFDLDHQLNLLTADLNRNFEFKLNNIKIRATLHVRIQINSKLNKKVSIEFLESNDIIFINELNDSLPALYGQSESDFFECYIKMFTILSESPTVFYTVFDSYPIYTLINKDIKQCFISILERFHHDYQEDKESLKAKLLLLDMQAI